MAIRAGLGTELNRRSLTRLPQFRPDASLPEQLHELLRGLEAAERTDPANRQAG